MSNLTEINIKGYNNPVARWARFGPYYAMFPLDFAFEVVDKYSKEGDYIIDPFAGRCSSIYAGGVLGRRSWGIEINPVGWLYGKVKLKPADENEVIERLKDIYSLRNKYKNQIKNLPEFFKYCFCNEVLSFLLAARQSMNWEENDVDATLMSIILVYLHGKLGEGLSNQMRQTKSMGPIYSVNWWKKHNFTIAPKINPFEFILKKIKWRYAKGVPNITDSYIFLRDSSTEFDAIAKRARKDKIKFSLLFTSPPYWAVTNYYADQWLRLWLLGGTDKPESTGEKHKMRFNSKIDYYNLLETVFSNCAKVMAKNSTVYVRTDAREFTFNSTVEILKKCFPKYNLKTKNKPFKNRTQTELFGDKSKKPGEIDIILTDI